MEGKEMILEELEVGTKQERDAASIVRKLEFVNVEDRMVGGIGVQDGKLSAFVNEDEFDSFPNELKKKVLVELGELVIGKYHIRGVGKEWHLWNLSVSMEMAWLYKPADIGRLLPGMFGFETELFAEEYYDLFFQKRQEIEESGVVGEDFLFQRTPLIQYNEELGEAIESILVAD